MINSEELSDFIQSELKSAKIPGCSLVVVDRRGIISAGAFGYADLHEGGGAGFTSETRIYPARGIGLVIAMNRMSMPQANMVAHRICEKIMSQFVTS